MGGDFKAECYSSPHLFGNHEERILRRGDTGKCAVAFHAEYIPRWRLPVPAGQRS